MSKVIIVFFILLSTSQSVFSIDGFELENKVEALAQALVYEKVGDYSSALVGYSLGGSELELYRFLSRMMYRGLEVADLEVFNAPVDEATEYTKSRESEGILWSMETLKIGYYSALVKDDFMMIVPTEASSPHAEQ